LLSWSDIITLHCSPSSSNDKALIGAEELGRMKKGAWLINVSRGGVVDEQALYHSLKKGNLTAAALDVYSQEPYSGPLKELDNIILTPHIGSYAKEARIKMEIEAVQNLLNGIKNI
jgi:D-3-phosphoglycerate dehydrogenase